MNAPARQIINLPTGQLRPHPDNEKIYGIEDVSELAQDIQKSGWIKPLVVTDFYGGYTIVSGHRRHKAAPLAGCDFVPCEVESFGHEWEVLDRLLRENSTRGKTGEQKAREFKYWKKVESEAARQRQIELAGTRPNSGDDDGDLSEIFHKGNTGRAADAAAEKAGFGTGRTAEKAEKAIDKIDELRANGQTVKADLIAAALNEENYSGALDFAEMVEDIEEGDLIPIVEEIKQGNKTSRQAKKDLKPNKPHVANNSGQNEWYTPFEYIEAARAAMGGIDLDPATSLQANEVVQAESIFTAADDGLTKTWFGNVWLNPPYKQPTVTQFCDKIVNEYHNGDVFQAVVLVNNGTETATGQMLLSQCAAVCFPKGRIKYWHPGRDSKTPLQGQMILYFGVNESDFLREFKKFGVCMTTN